MDLSQNKLSGTFLPSNFNIVYKQVTQNLQNLLVHIYMFVTFIGIINSILFIDLVFQQSKFFQVRGQVVDVLLTSIQCTLWQTVYFYPGFWLLGKDQRLF